MTTFKQDVLSKLSLQIVDKSKLNRIIYTNRKDKK